MTIYHFFRRAVERFLISPFSLTQRKGMQKKQSRLKILSIIAMSNSTKYGLGCSIFTRDIEKAMKAADEIQAGTFCINNPLMENMAAPFGGMKMSGGGRERGIEGLDEFRETKHILIDYQIREKDYWLPYDLDEGRKT